ncbi:MAG: DUF2213 domain-containing protein [Chthoniobacterales bacterium]|nr:DUF2213 domain-containing protein [Chthoniobacterales bacterium]
MDNIQPNFSLPSTGGIDDPEAKELLGDDEVEGDGGDLGNKGDVSAEDAQKTLDKHERAVMTAAMRLLQHARKTRTDSTDVGAVNRLDAGGKLSKAARTTLGGARVPATLTRTGVLKYRQGDGTVRRELRLPEEVFHADSLESLRGAAVTVGHPYEIGGLLDAGTFRKFTVGHTEDVRQDGKSFVAGNLVVQDGKTADAIDRGELSEVSLGYQCRMDATPGIWNGEPYDAIQRGITYNHVALLAPGRSRADVGLRLDSTDAVSVEETEQTMTVKIKLDGKDFDFGSEAHIEKIEQIHASAVTKLDSKVEEKKAALKAATAEKDELQGKLDALDSEHKKLQTQLAAASDPKALADKVNARVQLVVKARAVLGDEAKLDEKSDREIMVDVIKLDASDFNDAGKSDDYVRGRFESVEKTAVRVDSIDAIVRSVEANKRLDASDMSPVVRAQIEAIEKSRGLASAPIGNK